MKVYVIHNSRLPSHSEKQQSFGKIVRERIENHDKWAIPANGEDGVAYSERVTHRVPVLVCMPKQIRIVDLKYSAQHVFYFTIQKSPRLEVRTLNPKKKFSRRRLERLSPRSRGPSLLKEGLAILSIWHPFDATHAKIERMDPCKHTRNHSHRPGGGAPSPTGNHRKELTKRTNCAIPLRN